MSATSKMDFPYHPGKYTNSAMLAGLRTYCAIVGISLRDLTITQGSFNTTVAASAGTHNGPDCIDLTDYAHAVKCWVLKCIGIVAWWRTSAQGFSSHVHIVRLFTAAAAWLAAAQEKAYRDHKSDGLGNLTHTDTSHTPRYRSVKHLYGPSKNSFYAVRSTPGYSQPGCTPLGDKDLVKTTKEKRHVLSGVAGTVRCQGKEYFVATRGEGDMTFYLRSDFIKKWEGFVWENAAYTVDNAPAYGRTGPGLDKPRKAGCVRDRGYLVRSIGYCERGGDRFVCTAHGTFYAATSLKAV